MEEAVLKSEIPVKDDPLGKRFSHGNVNTNGTFISKKSFTCHICEKEFRSKCHLSRHLKTHTGEKPFECDICKKKFSEKYTVTSHMRSHTGERPYECIICKRTFLQSSHLRSHMNIHTGKKHFECKVCKKAFVQKGQLKSHLRIHTRETPKKLYECNICKIEYAYKYKLIDHMRSHTGEPNECDICKAKFLQSHLKSHMMSHSHTSKKAFSQIGHLKTHNIHIEKSFECNICKKTFGQKMELKSHMQIHRGEKPEKPQEYTISESRYPNKGRLKPHMISHADEKPYECISCKKKFIRQNQLKTRVEIHNIEKPYECNICKKKSSDNSTLREHKRIHTVKMPYEYNICKDYFLQESDFYLNINSHASKILNESDDGVNAYPGIVEKSEDPQLGSDDENEFSCVKEEISDGFNSDNSSKHVRESHDNSERCLDESFPAVDSVGLYNSGDGSFHLTGAAIDGESGDGYPLKSKTEGVHQGLQNLSRVLENVNNDGDNYRKRVMNIVNYSNLQLVQHDFLEHNEQQQQLPIREKESECRETKPSMYKDLDWIEHRKVGHISEGKRQNECFSMVTPDKMDDIEIKEHSMSSDSDGETNNIVKSGNHLSNDGNGLYHISLQSYNSLVENSNIVNRNFSCLERNSQTNVKSYARNFFPFTESRSDSSVIHTYPVAIPHRYPVAMPKRFGLQLFHDSPAAWETEQNEDIAMANYLENKAVNEFMEI